MSLNPVWDKKDFMEERLGTPLFLENAKGGLPNRNPPFYIIGRSLCLICQKHKKAS